MRFSDIIFPAESRSFPGKRWGNVISRSLHLCGAAVYTGGLYFGVTTELLTSWYILTAVSGFFMLGADLYSNGKNLFQNRGFLIVIKLIILGIYQHLHVGGAWLMLCIIFFPVSSHTVQLISGIILSFIANGFRCITLVGQTKKAPDRISSGRSFS